MMTMDLGKLERKLEEELKKANIVLDEDVWSFLENYDGPFSEALKQNAEISKKTGLPLCQDTGIVEFFVLMGKNFRIDPIELEKILKRSVKTVYTTEPFRYSVVADPIFDRRNTLSNSPPVIHFLTTDGESEIRFLIKGGGSENLSALFMMNPTADEEEVMNEIVNHLRKNGANSCPPLHVGVGVGGTSEKAMILSKLALTKKFDERNLDERYAKMEIELAKRMNELGIGYQGLGHGITVYSVHVEYSPTHIATLPVAVSVNCYLCRKGRLILD